jgi:hypothetical protein
MIDDEKSQEGQDAPDRERDPAGPVEPRGNPEPEEGATERGEDELEKVSGN